MTSPRRVGWPRPFPISRFASPYSGEAVVTSPFGYRSDPFLGRPMLHAGVDLREPYGAEIHATAPGRVTHAGPMGGYGDMVEIDHGDGLATRYGHMAEVDVREGDEVAAGAPLGRLGSTGRSTGPHLHYEVRIDGEPVDPERFLRAGEGSARRSEPGSWLRLCHSGYRFATGTSLEVATHSPGDVRS